MVQVAIGVGASALVTWMVVRLVATTREHQPGDRLRHVIARGTGIVVVAASAAAIVAFFPDFPRQGFARLTSEEGLRENLRSAFLPALTLAMVEFGVFMRVLRSDLIATLQEDYILAARAKGTPTWLILVRDALRPSSFSLVTIAGVALGRLVGGAVIVETIFNLPGMGGMLVEAIGVRNFPVVQGAVLVIALFYVLVNTTIDVAYSYLDPRIRRGRA
jgi:peptide/nickel transport system permease protein